MGGERNSTWDGPAVDQRLIMPNTRYEVVGGEVVHVSPANPPHASRHSKLQALLEAYATDGYDAACDMLTRTSEKNDFAPDGSIYPADPDPETGGRQLEELAFEIVSTETLAHAGRKAAELVGRGVRRVFAIDVERQRGLEWSSATAAWEILATDGVIEDPALVLPLAVHDLVAAGNADDAVARALLAKDNPVLLEAMAAREADAAAEAAAAATAKAVLTFLASRGIAVDDEQRRAILAVREPRALETMVQKAAVCGSAAELLAALTT
jgi:hypothetical protein